MFSLRQRGHTRPSDRIKRNSIRESQVMGPNYFEKLAAPSTAKRQRRGRPYIPTNERTPTSRGGTFPLIGPSPRERKKPRTKAVDRLFCRVAAGAKELRRERERDIYMHIQDVSSSQVHNVGMDTKRNSFCLTSGYKSESPTN